MRRLLIGLAVSVAPPIGAQALVVETYSSGVEVPLVAAEFRNGRFGYVVGGSAGGPGVLLCTSSGGRKWNSVALPGAGRLVDVALPDGGYHWACGENGWLYRSINGGRNWDALSIDVPALGDVSWCAIHFVGRKHGFAIGGGRRTGALAATEDGGGSWRSLVDRIPAGARVRPLRALAFATPALGFVCGDGGTLLRTEDGGRRWAQCSAEFGGALTCVSVLGEKTVFAGGEGGVLLNSVDGGVTWLPVPLPTADTVRGVVFASPTRGFVALDGEPPLYTRNGGTTWSHIGIDVPLTALSLGGDSVVWATGTDGRVFRIRPQAGIVRGVVRDSSGRPIAGAVVFPCRAETGEPIAADGLGTLTEMLASGRGKFDLASATSGDDGRFRLVIPEGSWRLVAQSWPGRPDANQPFEHHTKELQLHGVADSVRVAAGEAVDVELRPLGDASLEIDVDISNSWTVLALSTGAPHLPEILGFSAWGGDFGRRLIGGVRMTLGKTRVSGLPAGTVHVALFQNDNNPSFATARFDLGAGGAKAVELDLGRSRMSDSLRQLDGRLRRAGLSDHDLAHLLRQSPVGEFFEPVRTASKRFARFGLVMHRGHEPVGLPDGSEARCGDLLAVFLHRQAR